MSLHPPNPSSSIRTFDLAITHPGIYSPIRKISSCCQNLNPKVPSPEKCSQMSDPELSVSAYLFT